MHCIENINLYVVWWLNYNKDMVMIIISTQRNDKNGNGSLSYEAVTVLYCATHK